MSIHSQVAELIVSGKMTGLNALDEVRKLEDDIEQRGLFPAYAEALLIILGYSWENAGNAVGALIRATPEQRAQAYLEATKG